MARPGFSLAEMMIALAILGMGLLVIGAALPIGVRYTRDSVNMATGEAAAEYALDVIEQNICLRKTIADPILGRVVRAPAIFQPRDGTDPYLTVAKDPRNLTRDYEPIIKVRPLFAQTVIPHPGQACGRGDEFFDPNSLVLERRAVISEQIIRLWLGAPGSDPREADQLDAWGLPWMRPALSSVYTVYPPITPDTPFLPQQFFSAQYQARAVTTSEAFKVLDRRIAWTAFYRRVSYAVGSDPNVYEIIVVAVRVPSERHRFPVQDPTGVSPFRGDSDSLNPSNGSNNNNNSSGHDANTLSGASTRVTSAAPLPWLVTFTTLPAPAYGFDDNGFPRFGGPPPGEMRFQCTLSLAPLFPKGTIFIPARNDDDPSLLGTGLPDPNSRVGFGPFAPTALPIYEVIGRTDGASTSTIVVKFNGFYPRQGTGTPPAWEWPVWVIPPAFEDVDPSGNPVVPDESPIVGVARRYVRLREAP